MSRLWWLVVALVFCVSVPGLVADTITLNAADFVGCSATPGTCTGQHSTTTNVSGLGQVVFSAWGFGGASSGILTGTLATHSYAGVQSSLDLGRDEINNFFGELLRVEFLSAPVRIGSLALTRLFTHDDCIIFIGCITEQAQVQAYFNGTLLATVGASGNASGNVTLADPFGNLLVDRLEFSATQYLRSDFGLSSITASGGSEVPEPATLVLMGSALSGIWFKRRQQP